MQIYFKSNREGKKKAIETLLDGGIVLLPTETVFGVGCILSSYRSLVSLKHRPSDKKFPICVGSYEMINRVAEVNEFQKQVIEALLPGPITLILPVKNGFNKKVTVAIRYSNDRYLTSLINKIDQPIYLTSANISGQDPFRSAIEASTVFKDDVGCYIEGKVKIGQASTIVDITKNKIKIIREGPLTEEMILKKLSIKNNQGEQ